MEEKERVLAYTSAVMVTEEDFLKHYGASTMEEAIRRSRLSTGYHPGPSDVLVEDPWKQFLCKSDVSPV